MLPSAPLVITIVVGGAGFTKRSVTQSATIRRSTNGTSVSAASRHETVEMRKRGTNTMEKGLPDPSSNQEARFYAVNRALYGKHAAPSRKCHEAILELTDEPCHYPRNTTTSPGPSCSTRTARARATISTCSACP